MSINNQLKFYKSYMNPESKFLIAASGGPDSQCLLKAFSHVFGASRCVARGVDHGLRSEARKELFLAQELAASCGVDFDIITLNLEKGPNLMERAREARYMALYSEAKKLGCDFIVTGHNFNDQAETKMIKLMRGQKMYPMSTFSSNPSFGSDDIEIFRPFLNTKREDIVGYLNRWNVEFAEDPSNSNQDFLRVWIRKKLFPLMETRSPKIQEFIVNLDKWEK